MLRYGLSVLARISQILAPERRSSVGPPEKARCLTAASRRRRGGDGHSGSRGRPFNRFGRVARACSPRGCGNKVVAGLISSVGGGEGAFGERVGVVRAAVWPGLGALGAESGHDQPAASSFGNLTRLQAAAVSVNIQPTRAVPWWRVLRKPHTVLIQANASSIRLRVR